MRFMPMNLAMHAPAANRPTGVGGGSRTRRAMVASVEFRPTAGFLR